MHYSLHYGLHTFCTTIRDETEWSWIKISKVPRLLVALPETRAEPFQTLGLFEDDPPEGMSLNRIVDDIRSRLCSNTAATAELDMRLTLWGYRPDQAYDRLRFVPATRRLFDVSGDFPRIEPSELRHGILKATYVVSVDSCMRFEIEPEEAVSRIFRGDRKAKLNDLELSAEELIRLDESSELEFKSSLRWSYADAKVEPVLETVVLKSVAALANTRGGRLIIGVDDDGQVLGLEKDIATLKNQNSRDGFERHLFQLLANAFGAPFCSNNLEVTFPTVGGAEICIIRVRRSSQLLTVAKTDKSGNRSQAIYVRTGNATRELGMDEVIEFNSERMKEPGAGKKPGRK